MMKNVLIEMRHGLGDLVHLEPTLYLLKKTKKYKIFLIIRTKAHKELIEELNIVDKFYYFDYSIKNIVKIIKFICKTKREEKFDYGMISPITNYKFGILLLKLLGVKEIIYISKNRYIDLHRVERNLHLLDKLNINIPNKIYPKLIKSSIINEKKCISIVVSSNFLGRKKYFFFREEVDSKNWGIDNFKLLIRKLKKHDIEINIVGYLNEEKKIKELKEMFSKEVNIRNYINKTSIKELLILLDRSDLVIGSDTGIQHIAAAKGKKTITLFGPTDPKIIGPYSPNAIYMTSNLECQYCYGSKKMFECIRRKCLERITVEAVYNKILEEIE